MNIDLAEFVLTNKETLRNDIVPDVKQFLSRSTIFDGLFRQVFNDHLKMFIIQQLKLNVLREFSGNLTFNEIYDTIDQEFLELITDNYFFDRDYYEQVNI